MLVVAKDSEVEEDLRKILHAELSSNSLSERSSKRSCTLRAHQMSVEILRAERSSNLCPRVVWKESLFAELSSNGSPRIAWRNTSSRALMRSFLKPWQAYWEVELAAGILVFQSSMSWCCGMVRRLLRQLWTASGVSGQCLGTDIPHPGISDGPKEGSVSRDIAFPAS